MVRVPPQRIDRSDRGNHYEGAGAGSDLTRRAQPPRYAVCGPRLSHREGAVEHTAPRRLPTRVKWLLSQEEQYASRSRVARPGPRPRVRQPARRRGASIGLVAARPPPASQRCARATRKALSPRPGSQGGRRLRLGALRRFGSHRRPGLLVLARVDGPRHQALIGRGRAASVNSRRVSRILLTTRCLENVSRSAMGLGGRLTGDYVAFCRARRYARARPPPADRCGCRCAS